MSLPADDPGTQRGRFHLDPSHQGPVVFITAVVLFITVVLSTVARLAEIPAKKRRATLADAIILLANLFALGQTISICLAVRYGMGEHTPDPPNPPRLHRFDDTVYISGLFSILAQACAKASVIALGDLLHPRWHRLHRRLIILTVALWTVFALLALAFQCGRPDWQDYSVEGCAVDAFAVQLTVGLINAASDAYLAVFMLPAIWRLKMETGTRVMLTALFTPRMLVCVPQITALAYLPAALNNPDQTWSETRVAIIAQTTLALSLITANLPSMKRLLYALQTGQSGTRLTARQEAQLELNGSRGFTRRTDGPSTISYPSSYVPFSSSPSDDASTTKSKSHFFLFPRSLRSWGSRHDSTRASTSEKDVLACGGAGGGSAGPSSPPPTAPRWPSYPAPTAQPSFWRAVDVRVEVEVRVEEAPAAARAE